MQKCIDHINNGSYQLLKKDITTKSKTKTSKQLSALKDNEFIDNKLYYYLKPAYSPGPRFYGQPKIHKPGVPKILKKNYKRPDDGRSTSQNVA